MTLNAYAVDRDISGPKSFSLIFQSLKVDSFFFYQDELFIHSPSFLFVIFILT